MEEIKLKNIGGNRFQVDLYGRSKVFSIGCFDRSISLYGGMDPWAIGRVNAEGSNTMSDDEVLDIILPAFGRIFITYLFSGKFRNEAR